MRGRPKIGQPGSSGWQAIFTPTSSQVGDNAVEEIFEVFRTACPRPHSCRVPATCSSSARRSGSQPGRLKPLEFSAVRRTISDRGHRAQLGLVVIQTVGAVLRNDACQIRAQPVKHRHEVIHDDLHASTSPDCGWICSNSRCIRSRVGRPSLMSSCTLTLSMTSHSRPAACTSSIYFLISSSVPYLACGFVIEHAHQPRAAGNLFDLLAG